jgi:ligand-binding SRPBCC domain-containing protein
VSVIELTVWIAAPPAACFDLSRSIDAHTGSMARSKEKAIGGVTSGLIGLGEEVTWQARHFGIRFRMRSRISAYDRPRCFIDEQTDGPFASWWHRHSFEPERGGTRMIDEVRYEVRAGVAGRIFDHLLLQRYMTELLTRRNAYIKATLEAT